MRSMICCCMILAMPAVAAESHLAGTWKGTAEKKVCGKSAGSENVTLSLRDTNAKAADAMPTLVGALTTGSSKDATVDLLFDTVWHRIQSTRVGTTKTLFGHNDLSPYMVLLQVGDQASSGDYRSLSGTLTMKQSACTELGSEGEVLTVTLKKQ